MDSLELLHAGKMPERYLRNQGTIGVAGQEKLCRSRIAVIGAGGLGGFVIELLARLGVGFLRVVDGDIFARHNWNRQLLAEEDNLSGNKALAAARRVAAINSEVVVEACALMLDEENAASLLDGVELVVDALDSIPTRLILGRAAKKKGIPLVHAAIAGYTGQVMTVFPEDPGLERLYERPVTRGVEVELGNLSPTPALAAALQVQEVVKVITGRGEPLRNKLLYFDAEWNLFEIMEVAKR